MLDALQRYVYQRRRGFIQSAVFLYGSYALSSYVSDRLEDMRNKTLRDKLAKENLRRRFQSTHDDVCFTIMALMPTLASQILEDMDVESLTNELQSLSRASRSRSLQPPPNPPLFQSVSDLGSSVSDVQSDTGSMSLSSYSESSLQVDRASAASGSWVEQISASEGPPAPPNIPTTLSDSITSTDSSLSHNGQSMENSVTSTSPRTKSQLWNEVKILALTRTLTTMYTITLLSLFTSVQLNLLGRSRYIGSVQASERAECALEKVPDFSLTDILAREAIARIVNVEEIWPAWILGEHESGDEDVPRSEAISEATELRFLTLSWWLLHVGWKDVAARIRGSVESVFDDVSLKAKLSPSELFTLIMDVRRRVETDGTDSKLGARFLSSLLPPTPETTAHVLAQGGALSIPRGSEASGNIMRGSLPFREPGLSSSPHGDVESSISVYPSEPHSGLSRGTAIEISSPVARLSPFPTPPSSHAHESDLSSGASSSPSTSPGPHPRPAPPTTLSDPLVTSRSALDVDPQFNALLAETRQYLSGPDFAYALTCALDRATEVLMDGLRARVFVDTANAVNVANGEDAQARSLVTSLDVGTGEEQKEDVKVRLAGLLPGLAKWCQLALNATPNELVDNIMAVREVNALEAIIISDYEDRFPAVS